MATDIDELQIQIQSSTKGANASITALTKRLDKLSSAINGIDTKKVNSIGIGLNSVGTGSKSASAALNKTATSATKAAKSFNGLASALGKFYATYFLFIRGAKSIWSNVQSSMDYVETSNYFSVALGQIGQQFEKAGYESAELYAEALTSELSDLNKKLTGYSLGASGEALFSGDVGLGMDIEQMMNFQAKTLSVTNSVGLMGDASIETAKAVSMLAGDISSLTNTDLDTVMTNLSSGLIGQSRALYKYGIDITQNTLQQYALAEGIEKSVAEMTQAEKMQLRLLAILDQSNVAQADLANTVNSVANQYRIFEQQVGNTGRTLGNLFLPIVQNVLPYVNGLIIALNNLFTSLGFEIYGETWLEDLQQGISGGVQEDFEDITDSADDATTAINKFKKGVRSFDELNVITGGTSVGSGVPSELEGQIDLTESITKAVADYENSWNAAFATAENKASEFAKQLTEDFDGVAEMFDTIFPAITGIGTALATYKIASGIGGITSALGVLGSPLGIASLAAGVLAGITVALKDLWEEAKTADIESRFGEISLSLEDIDEVAKSILDNQNLTGVKTLLSEIGNLSGIQSEIENSVSTLDKLNWKVSIGMELTEEEQEQYKTAIDTYISNVSGYIEQQQYAANIGIKLFLSDSQTSEEVQAVVNEFYSSQSEKLRKLGEDLNKATTEAWNDGLLTVDEVEVISNIQMQMAEIQNKISTSEFEARLQILESDYSGAALTPESYRKLVEERNALFEDYKSELNESLVFSLSQINLAYQAKLDEASTEEAKEEIKKEWDEAVKDIYLSRDEKIGKMSLNALTFDIGTLSDTYEKELEKALPDIMSVISETAKKISEIPPEYDYENVTEMYLDEMEKEIDSMTKYLSAPAKANLKNLINELQPTEDLEALATSYYEKTGEVPQAIADALISQYALESLIGSRDSMLKAMVITDDSIQLKTVVASAETLGSNVVKALSDGIDGEYSNLQNSMVGFLSNLSNDLSDDAYNVGKKWREDIDNGLMKSNVSSVGFNTALGLLGKVKGYASGGLVTAGEVFVARENGIPEMVGSFGNQTAVANNDQIVDGIRAGVYSAMVSALSTAENNSGGDIVINMDGREVFRVVQTRASEHFRKTGNPAFDF